MANTRMESRIEVLEKSLERGDRASAEMREQIVLTGRKVDQFQGQIAIIGQKVDQMHLQFQSQMEWLERLLSLSSDRQVLQVSLSGVGQGGGGSGAGHGGNRSIISARKDPQLYSVAGPDGSNSGGDGIGENLSFISARKVELPSFRGEDPFSLLSKAVQKFSIQNTVGSLKIHCTRKIERKLDAPGTWSMANDKEGPRFGLGDRNKAELGRGTGSTLSGPRTNIHTISSSTTGGGSLTPTTSTGSKPNPRNSVAGNSASATPASSGAGSSGCRPNTHRVSSSATGGVEGFRCWKPEVVYHNPESKMGDLPTVTSQRLTRSRKKREGKRLQQEEKIPLYRPLCQLRLVESKNRTKQGRINQLKKEKRKLKREGIE